MNEWKKSSFCGTNACVEVKFNKHEVYVREPGSFDFLAFTTREWKTFIQGVKNGEFDVD